MSDKKYDPWDIDPKESAKKKREYSGGSKGIPCPKRNLTGDKVCKVCDKMKSFWNKPEGSPERETYKAKKATFAFFLNVVFENDKTKPIILEIGKNAGDAIINGIGDEVKNWKSIAHPKANRGLITCIKKFKKDNQNSYDVYVKTDKPDWDIPDSVIENLTNLDRENIVKLLENDELTEENYMKLSDIKMGETLTFRICPHWDTEKRSLPPLEFLARHWHTTEDEITGKAEVTLVDDSYEDGKPAPKQENFNSPKPEKSADKKPEPARMKCFGDSAYFDPDDDDCTNCKFFKECRSEIKRSGMSESGIES